MNSLQNEISMIFKHQNHHLSYIPDIQCRRYVILYAASSALDFSTNSVKVASVLAFSSRDCQVDGPTGMFLVSRICNSIWSRKLLLSRATVQRHLAAAAKERAALRKLTSALSVSSDTFYTLRLMKRLQCCVDIDTVMAIRPNPCPNLFLLSATVVANADAFVDAASSTAVPGAHGSLVAQSFFSRLRR